LKKNTNEAPNAVNPQVKRVAYNAPNTGSVFSKNVINVSILIDFNKSFANLGKLLEKAIHLSVSNL